MDIISKDNSVLLRLWGGGYDPEHYVWDPTLTFAREETHPELQGEFILPVIGQPAIAVGARLHEHRACHSFLMLQLRSSPKGPSVPLLPVSNANDGEAKVCSFCLPGDDPITRCIRFHFVMELTGKLPEWPEGEDRQQVIELTVAKFDEMSIA